MNLNDYRLAAYGKKNDKAQSTNLNNTNVNSEKKKTENTKKQPPKFTSDDALVAATEALTSGGLIKVPIQKDDKGQDSVYRRVAKFLILIGVDQAASVLKHLSQEETEKIIPEISSIRNVTPDEAISIFAEFEALKNRVAEGGGVETAQTILEKAFGYDKAQEMISHVVPVNRSKPFEYLHDASKEKIYALLKDESSAIRALVLSNLVPKTAAAVINLMSPEEKKEVVLRLAKMQSVSPDVLDRIDRTMHEKSLAVNDEKTSSIDGRDILSQIIKRMDITSGNDILSAISTSDKDLGDDLRSRMFTEEDVLNADDRFIQEYLRSMTETDIAYLIATKDDGFRKKIFSNMSKARGDTILEEEQIRKPMRRSDCDTITNKFYSDLRKAHEDGTLAVLNHGDDIYV